MNTSLKGNIVKVKRSAFTNPKTGEVMSFCRFAVLVMGKTDENETGYDYEVFSCKVDHYNKLIELLKSNKAVEVLIEFVKQTDGNYKRRARKLDEYSL